MLALNSDYELLIFVHLASYSGFVTHAESLSTRLLFISPFTKDYPLIAPVPTAFTANTVI